MKNLIKKLTLTSCILFTGSASAELKNFSDKGSVCTVEIISGMCGSGFVTLTYFEDKFKLKNGDIKCWGSDVIKKGTFQNHREGYPINSIIADLIIKNRDDENVNIGTFTYRKRRW